MSLRKDLGRDEPLLEGRWRDTEGSWTRTCDNERPARRIGIRSKRGPGDEFDGGGLDAKTDSASAPGGSGKKQEWMTNGSSRNEVVKPINLSTESNRQWYELLLMYCEQFTGRALCPMIEKDAAQLLHSEQEEL